jgi:hypothetical protein
MEGAFLLTALLTARPAVAVRTDPCWRPLVGGAEAVSLAIHVTG